MKLHDEFRIGNRRAVVCMAHSPGQAEVVYLDVRDRAVNEAAVWRGDVQSFEHSGPAGGYVDKYDRLTPFVAQLHRPRT